MTTSQQVEVKQEAPPSSPKPEKKSRVDDVLTGYATGNKDLINKKVEPIKEVDVSSKSFESAAGETLLAEKSKKQPVKVPMPEPEPLAAKAEEKKEVTEYGLPVEDHPGKTYTETEVQNMMRDRLKRIKDDKQLSASEVKQVKEEFKSDNNQTEDWERDLEGFVDKVVDRRESKAHQKQLEQQEIARQSDFEAKMDTGTIKYQDFWPVLNRAAITPHMMIAARELDTPSDFLYAAAKLQPKELERISQIKNPATVLIEIGRLEERMKKTSRVTASPRPLDRIKGDSFDEPAEKKETKGASIEERIAQHAKAKKGL